jgi:hypothetical protein
MLSPADLCMATYFMGGIQRPFPLLASIGLAAHGAPFRDVSLNADALEGIL